MTNLRLSKKEALRWGIEFNGEAHSLGLEGIQMFDKSSGLLLIEAFQNIADAYGDLVKARRTRAIVAHHKESGFFIYNEFDPSMLMKIKTEFKTSGQAIQHAKDYPKCKKN